MNWKFHRKYNKCIMYSLRIMYDVHFTVYNVYFKENFVNYSIYT